MALNYNFPRVDVTTTALQRKNLSPVTEDTLVLFAPFKGSYGPINEVVICHSYADFTDSFGELDYNINGQNGIQIKNWLDNGGTVYAVRVEVTNEKLPFGSQIIPAKAADSATQNMFASIFSKNSTTSYAINALSQIPENYAPDISVNNNTNRNFITMPDEINIAVGRIASGHFNPDEGVDEYITVSQNTIDGNIKTISYTLDIPLQYICNSENRWFSRGFLSLDQIDDIESVKINGSNPIGTNSDNFCIDYDTLCKGVSIFNPMNRKTAHIRISDTSFIYAIYSDDGKKIQNGTIDLNHQVSKFYPDQKFGADNNIIPVKVYMNESFMDPYISDADLEADGDISTVIIDSMNALEYIIEYGFPIIPFMPVKYYNATYHIISLENADYKIVGKRYYTKDDSGVQMRYFDFTLNKDTEWSNNKSTLVDRSKFGDFYNNFVYYIPFESDTVDDAYINAYNSLPVPKLLRTPLFKNYWGNVAHFNFPYGQSSGNPRNTPDTYRYKIMNYHFDPSMERDYQYINVMDRFAAGDNLVLSKKSENLIKPTISEYIDEYIDDVINSSDIFSILERGNTPYFISEAFLRYDMYDINPDGVISPLPITDTDEWVWNMVSQELSGDEYLKEYGIPFTSYQLVSRNAGSGYSLNISVKQISSGIYQITTYQGNTPISIERISENQIYHIFDRNQTDYFKYFYIDIQFIDEEKYTTSEKNEYGKKILDDIISRTSGNPEDPYAKIKLEGGRDSSASQDELVKLYFADDAFKADRTKIVDKLKYPIDVFLDAGYSLNTKTAIYEAFCSDEYNPKHIRNDVFVYMDLFDSNGTSLERDILSLPETINTRNLALYTQRFNIKYADKQMWVTPNYFISKLLPRNAVLNNRGVHEPIAGLNRAVLNLNDTIVKVNESLLPERKQELFDSRINYADRTATQIFFANQRTKERAADNTALQFINNSLTTNRLVKDVERLCRQYLFEYNDSITIGNLTKQVNKYLETYIERRALAYAVVEISKSPYSEEQLDVKLNIKYNGTVEVISIDLTIL